ncbi:phosphorylcholine transferase LicD [Carboxylicivirga sp. M1479]|uniref:LicD family protein n=1 Tax=Carboxylicivirga sp. M1479 TaxID=2594476 RepID=UPI001177F422|nr:LicD family protein [Carboxylicivirga sp. M1479]TRX66235.1 LicD family protein [Carboxylicivirga sp. M1479]
MDYKKEVREAGKTPIEQTQLVLLEMIRIVDEICREHDIKYWLTGGTLLGAIRHKGFIPWDDDADLAMSRKDYEKFLKIAPTKLPYGLFFQSAKTDSKRTKWVRIRDDYSTINLKNEQGKNYTYHKGIFLDIFPYDIIDRDFYNTKVFYTRRFKKSKKTILKRSRLILQPISKVISWTVGPDKWKNKILRRYLKRSPKYVATGIEVGDFHSVMRYHSVFPLSEINFLGNKFMAPNNPDHYLIDMFGNYMQLPAKEDRIVHAYELLPFTKCNHPNAKDY